MSRVAAIAWVVILSVGALPAGGAEPPAIDVADLDFAWYVAPEVAPAIASGPALDVSCTITVSGEGAILHVEVDATVQPAIGAAVHRALLRSRLQATGVPSVRRVVTHLGLPGEEASASPPIRGSARSISGVVSEAGVRTPLASVTVVAAGLGRQTLTGADGRFSLALPPGEHLLVASAAFFAPSVTAVRMETDASNQSETLYLYRKDNAYSTTIRGERDPKAASKTTLSSEELRNMPGSQNDPLRSVETLPGLARAPLGGGQLIVRGSRPVDTGAYYDGQRIPILYHLLNGPSVLQEDVVSRIDFFAGGAGAYYGRQLAGIVEVTPKTGGELLHGTVAVDLNKSSASVSGPLGDAVRFALGGRVSYINPALELAAGSHTSYQVPSYWDYQSRLEVQLPLQTKATLTLFGSGDSFAQVNPGQGNANALSDEELVFHRLQLRLETRLGDGWTLVLAPQAGVGDEITYSEGTGVGALAEPQRSEQHKQSLGMRGQLLARHSERFETALGVDTQFERVRFQEDRQVATQLAGSQGGWNAVRVVSSGLAHFANVGAYVQENIEVGALRLTPGVRLEVFRWTGNASTAVEPRLWARWTPFAQTELFGYAGLYHQAPEAAEIDPILGNPALGPERSQQYGLGLNRRWGDEWSVRVEGFIQRREQLPFAAQATLRADGTISNPLLEATGFARAYGLEVLLRKELSAHLFGWISYTLAKSEQIERPGWQWEPTVYDQRHVLTLLVGWRPSTQVEFSSRVRLASGNPVRTVTGSSFNADTGTYVTDTAPFGSAHLPTFVQADLQVNNIWTSDLFKLSLYAECQNLFARRNAEFQVYNYRFDQEGSIPGVPILGAVGAKVSF
ncbi:MAG: TonB-dependent receptor [Deltaproteobacteria bacterium]|nr:TonB-dependent receptor [Deltaproteobacteria bacterium]